MTIEFEFLTPPLEVLARKFKKLCLRELELAQTNTLRCLQKSSSLKSQKSAWCCNRLRPTKMIKFNIPLVRDDLLSSSDRSFAVKNVVGADYLPGKISGQCFDRRRKGVSLHGIGSLT